MPDARCDVHLGSGHSERTNSALCFHSENGSDPCTRARAASMAMPPASAGAAHLDCAEGLRATGSPSTKELRKVLLKV
jgi:hypothetical protein